MSRDPLAHQVVGWLGWLETSPKTLLWVVIVERALQVQYSVVWGHELFEHGMAYRCAQRSHRIADISSEAVTWMR